LFAAGCMPNEHGRLSATRTGTLIDPPATRTRANEELELDCGVAAWRTGEHAVLRSPYMQQVRSDGAAIVWTSSASRPERVTIEAAGGGESRLLEGKEQATTFLAGAHQYAVEIEGLVPATTYCYSLVDDAGVVRGPIGFRTAPPPSDTPVDFLVFGDSGSGDPDQWALRQQMDTVPIDLIVHLGDLAYPSGTLQQYEDYVFNVYEELFESFPFFPASGNHDYETADAGPFREVFMMPENGGNEGHERWYSFDWGPIHFVALDTEVMSQTQAEWLDRDLGSTELPWTIVFAHRPPYSSGSHGEDMAMRGMFGPIFDRHDVPLVLTGHDHHYERTDAIQGTTYFVSGGGGSSSRKPTANPYTAFAEDVMHFLSVHVEQDEILIHAIDGMGREFDSVRIARGAQ
jgi:3',5'-cyclic AMP phosphodiesterase CpdA